MGIVYWTGFNHTCNPIESSGAIGTVHLIATANFEYENVAGWTRSRIVPNLSPVVDIRLLTGVVLSVDNLYVTINANRCGADGTMTVCIHKSPAIFLNARAVAV